MHKTLMLLTIAKIQPPTSLEDNKDNTTQASLLRALLLIVTTVGYQNSSTPPAGNLTNNAARKTSQPNGGQNGHAHQGKISGVDGSNIARMFGEALSEGDIVHDAPNGVVSHLAQSAKNMQTALWTITTVEFITRVLSLIAPSSHLLSTFCPSHPRHALTTPSSPTLVLLTVTILSGVSIRRACFKALGKNFTFAHMTRAKHSLITWGPYAYARHASYTSLSITHLGSMVVLLSPGGWMQECGGWDAFVRGGVLGKALLCGMYSLALAFVVWNTVAIVEMLVRAPKEDETVKAKFGKEWEAYRDRVPWRFIPLVV